MTTAVKFRFPGQYPLLAITACTALIVSTTATAASFSARNAAMGGAGVASSKYDAAAGSNPALLTKFADNDDIAIILPAIAVEGSDEHDVIDTLEDVTDLVDQLENQIDATDPNALATKDDILAKLADVDEKTVRADAAALIGLAIPGKAFAFALEVKSRVDIFGYADYDPNDEIIIDAAIIAGDSDILDNLGSEALIFGVQVDEVALSFAREFNFGDKPLAVGITPKYQKVETIVYNTSVRDFDEDDFDSDEYTEDDSNLNLDIGLALSLSEAVTVGLQLSDLIEQDYDTVDANRHYTLEPQATAGIAWQGSTVTLALDVDLTERQPFDEIDGSQFARAGAEFDIAGWLQLRAGIRHDMQGTREDLLTAGIGISPFNTFHLDLTVGAGDEDNFGGAMDLRFTF